MEIRLGGLLMAAGIIFQFVNILTYKTWGLSIDFIGLLMFLAGLVLFIIYKEWKPEERVK